MVLSQKRNGERQLCLKAKEVNWPPPAKPLSISDTYVMFSYVQGALNGCVAGLDETQYEGKEKG